MATWQFSFHLISREKALAIFGEIPSSIDWDEFNSVNWWENFHLSEDHIKILDSFLSRSSHWDPMTTLWGEENGDRIEVSKDDLNQVNYISVRVNVGNRDDRFIEGTIKFSIDIDSLILTSEQGSVAEPSVEFLLTEIRRSSAYTFVKDPIAFFKSIDTSHVKLRGYEEDER